MICTRRDFDSKRPELGRIIKHKTTKSLFNLNHLIVNDVPKRIYHKQKNQNSISLKKQQELPLFQSSLKIIRF